MICAVLATNGTKEAVPGLLEAIAHKRILPPTPEARSALPWLAALSIASRDPWPGVDAWLAGLVARRDLLVLRQDDGPELGATAARILLRRHDKPPGAFHVVPVATLSVDLTDLHVEGYRFRRPDDAAQVQAWWKQHAK
jgi:hypothetical protein